MNYKKDYYKILQINKNASMNEIKKAFYKLAKQYHPDINKHDPLAEIKFKEINEAYSILYDRTLRNEYDFYYSKYHSDFRDEKNYSNNSSNKYTKQTNKTNTNKKSKSTSQKLKVEKNIKIEVEITYMELYFLKEKNIQYLQSFYDQVNKVWYQKLNNVSFNIPFDYKEGLIFKQKGNQSNRGLMKFGDLIVTFKLKKSNIFYIDESGILHQNLIIDMLSAIKGVEMNILTPKKEMKKITIPKNTNNKEMLVLNNYGLYKDENKNIRNDLIIDVVYDKIDYFSNEELEVLNKLYSIHKSEKSLMNYYYELNKELEV